MNTHSPYNIFTVNYNTEVEGKIHGTPMVPLCNLVASLFYIIHSKLLKMKKFVSKVNCYKLFCNSRQKDSQGNCQQSNPTK